MKQWFRKLWLLSVLSVMGVGCKQQLFLNKECYDNAHDTLLTALDNGHPTLIQPAPVTNAPLPTDVTQPEREIFNLTLQEALTLALENGNTGGAPNTNNTSFDDQIVVGAPNLNQAEKIRVYSINPAIQSNALEVQLGRYDTMFGITTSATVTDELSQSLQSFSNGQQGIVDMGFIKPLPTGGMAGIVFDNSYRYFSAPPVGFNVLNPTYNSRLALHFEQPLWQNYGTTINQLLSRHPSLSGNGLGNIGVNSGDLVSSASNRLNNTGTGLGSNTNGGILLQRVTFDQSRAEFERQVQTLLLNVEVAYWKLYQAYGQLYSNEEVLRIAHRAWMINKAKFDAGTIGPKDYHPVRGQFEEFRGERVASLANVLERERILRALIGLPVEDGKRLVPVTPPTLAPYVPDWTASVNEAMVQRPELMIFRDEVLKVQYSVEVQKNFLKPQLNFYSNYAAVGTGTRMDGAGTFQVNGIDQESNVFRSLSGTRFNDFNLGLSFLYPLGFRPESANVRTARLQLAQSFMRLKDQEERITRSLAFQWQEIAKWYNLIETRRNERKAYADSVEARFKEFAAGKTTIADFLLEAQRRLATAQVKEFEAISEYNNALVRYQWAKGNMLRHNSIVVQEGPLPNCALESAVKNERERTRAFVLRNPRPDPFEAPGRLVGNAAIPEDGVITTPNPITGAPLTGVPINGGGTVIPPDMGGTGTMPLPAQSSNKGVPAWITNANKSTGAPATAPTSLAPSFVPAPTDGREPVQSAPALRVPELPAGPVTTPPTLKEPVPTSAPPATSESPLTSAPDLNFRQADPTGASRGMRPMSPEGTATPTFTPVEPLPTLPRTLPPSLPSAPTIPGMPIP